MQSDTGSSVLVVDDDAVTLDLVRRVLEADGIRCRTALSADVGLAVTGIERFVVVPSPSWPDELRPQQRTAPPDRRAHVWYAPAAMLVTPDSGSPPGDTSTTTGTDDEARVPSPSWP